MSSATLEVRQRSAIGADVFIGAGRGARVYMSRQSDGTTIAKKVFVGSGLARLVHQFCFGSDNPYVWDPTALEEARQRRRVLQPLVRFWLGGKASVAHVIRTGWNDELNVNEWTMEFVDGRSALLRQPFSDRHDDELLDLTKNVMRPLQRHLVEAGFDGAAWQAGLYNPVASSNFLRRIRADGGAEWVWIDVESGVPALFPANPLGLFTYYLPRSFKFGRPLFDDVDALKLQRYLSAHEIALRRDLGEAAWECLMRDVRQFKAASAQSRWRRCGRIERGIEARLQRQEITPDQARYFRSHKAQWVFRETVGAAAGTARAIARRLVGWFRPTLWFRICRESMRLVLSDTYRTKFARNYVARSIERWRRRKQLLSADVDTLTGELESEGSAVYLTDFGMHLACKPIVKLISWGVVPILYALGMMNELAFAILVVWSGAIARTFYTLMRIAIAHRNGLSHPWIALTAGVLPVLGNVAFPLQLVFDGVSDGKQLSQFIVYDTLTRTGQLMPIWGGNDTLTEHRANRLADRLLSLARAFRRRDGSRARRSPALAGGSEQGYRVHE